MATLAARTLLRTPARHFSRSIKAPQLEPISLREYRIASKLKRRFQPPAHREFMELMNAMQLHDFDTEHPAVVAAPRERRVRLRRDDHFCIGGYGLRENS